MQHRTPFLVAGLALGMNVDSAMEMCRRELRQRNATYTSSFVGDIRGKIGGCVFSKARGGTGTIRALVTPRNPRSISQLTVRASIAALSSYWAASLTAPERAAWNAIGTDTKSGFDIFVGNNSLLQQAGVAIVDAAPLSPNLAWLSIPDETDFVLEYDSGTLKINMTSNSSVYSTAGNKLMFYIQTRKQRPGVAAMSSNLRFVGAITTAASATTINVPASIANGIGTPTEGDESYVKVRAVKSTGEVTGEITARIPWTIT